MDAPCGSCFILKTQEEVGVVQQFAAQNPLQRRRTVAHRDLLGEEDCTHAALTQAADRAKTAGQSRGK